MRSIKVSKDVVPLGEFKSKASSILRSLSEQQRPLLITQNGQSACVLLAPEEYDSLCEINAFFEEIAMNLTETNHEFDMSVDEVRKRLADFQRRR